MVIPNGGTSVYKHIHSSLYAAVLHVYGGEYFASSVLLCSCSSQFVCIVISLYTALVIDACN